MNKATVAARFDAALNFAQYNAAKRSLEKLSQTDQLAVVPHAITARRRIEVA